MKGNRTAVKYMGKGFEIYIRSDLASACKKEGIPGEVIKRHYDRWSRLNIPCTYDQAALRALEEIRMNRINKREVYPWRM